MSWYRLPIRLRLTLAFTLAAAVIVIALGFGVRAILSSSLTDRLHDQLGADARAVGGAYASGDRTLSGSDPRLLAAGVSFGQVLDRNGRVLASTPAGAADPFTPAQLAQARRTGVAFVSVRRLPGVDQPAVARLQALSGSAALVATGASLDDHQLAIQRIDLMFAIGGPLLILALAAGAYILSGAALAPVSRMSTEARTGAQPADALQLTLPVADDEIRLLGMTLNDLLARISAQRDHERAFLAGASHELRTPLAVLTQELELAAAPQRTEDELRAALASARDEVALLTRISGDLLFLARADAAEPVLEPPMPLDVDDLLDRVRTQFAHPARTASRAIEVTPSGALIAGDAVRLRQAIGNLVDNALCHGGGPVELGSTQSADGGCVITVADRGPGIAVADRERMFERFVRGAHPAGSGSGLGLAIVRTVVAAHGGRATLRERAGGGVEARLELPPRAVERGSTARESAAPVAD